MLTSFFQTKPKDILIAAFADMHTGSSTALHPNVRWINGKWTPIIDLQGWKYKHNHHYYLNSIQERIWNHYEGCLDATAQLREGKNLIMLNLGDAIDGVHHNTQQITTRNITEQKDVHVELMRYTKERVKYQGGDMLLYLAGTDVHVGDEEDGIGKDLGAYQFNDGFYSASFIQMEKNGKLIWAFHKGAAAGLYPMRGNAANLLLKRIFYECRMAGERVPDLVFSAHTHDPEYFTYTMDHHTIHYVIAPSWQDKTRFVNDNMAIATNKIGMYWVTISGEGEIKVLPPALIRSPRGEFVR